MHLDVNIVRKYLEDNKREKLRRIIKESEIPDLAILIDQLSDQNKLKLYLTLPTTISSEVLLEVSQHSRKYILKSLKDKYIISMIEKADSDDSADILGEVPEHKVKRIMANLPKKKKEAIEPLIEHEDDTAGGLMQSELIALTSNITVSAASKRIKQVSKDHDGIYYVYVTDENKKLKGVVSLQALITADPKRKLSQIMNKDIIKLKPTLDKEKVAEIFMNEDFLALPVIDNKGRLLGRVTVDDVMDVMEEEATEDMFKIAGVHPDENVFDPFHRSLRRRLPWLIINLGTAILAALTISLFTDTLKAVVILAAFMPIVAGMGGNAGTQTLTLIIRGIALNQINLTNYKKVLWKEIFLGITNGILTGIIMAIIAYIWTSNIIMGIVILLAMTANLFVAGLIGTSIPLILKSMKIDPAVASAVFITTFTDIVGFFSFLGIATLLMQWLI